MLGDTHQHKFNLHQGDRLEGWFEIEGDNDIMFWVNDPFDRRLLDPGKVTGRYEFNVVAQQTGVYTLHWQNCFFCRGRTIGLHWRIVPAESAPSAGDAGGSAVAAVARFYDLLSQRRFSEAYSLLSDDLRSQLPYDQWVAGYDTTDAISVEFVGPGSRPDIVNVSVIAVDRLSTGEVTRHFAGQWYLTQDGGRWLLDRGDIRQVP